MFPMHLFKQTVQILASVASSRLPVGHLREELWTAHQRAGNRDTRCSPAGERAPADGVRIGSDASEQARALVPLASALPPMNSGIRCAAR